jgi:hypothetical protein
MKPALLNISLFANDDYGPTNKQGRTHLGGGQPTQAAKADTMTPCVTMALIHSSLASAVSAQQISVESFADEECKIN